MVQHAQAADGDGHGLGRQLGRGAVPARGRPGVQQHAVEKGDDAHQVRHLEGQDELRRVVQLLLVEDVVSAKGKIKFKRVWWGGGGGG